MAPQKSYVKKTAGFPGAIVGLRYLSCKPCRTPQRHPRLSLALFPSLPDATVPTPGETEAGSAGAQPDRGITRPTARRWRLAPWSSRRPGGFSLAVARPRSASVNATDVSRYGISSSLGHYLYTLTNSATDVSRYRYLLLDPELSSRPGPSDAGAMPEKTHPTGHAMMSPPVFGLHVTTTVTDVSRYGVSSSRQNSPGPFPKRGAADISSCYLKG